MSDKRAGVFEDDLDISGFAPKPSVRAEQIKAVAEEAGFHSRGPVSPQHPASVPAGQSAKALRTSPPEVQREQRRYRTGRNQQLNLKVRPQDADALYAIADAQGWVLGEAFAHAIAALTRELDAKE